MLHAYGLLLVNFSVLNRDLVCRWCQSSNDQDHADGNVHRRDTVASREAVGDDGC
jgi:hypothetical protein